MKTSLYQIKKQIRECYIEQYKTNLALEGLTENRVFSGKDIHAKVANLFQKANKIEKVASKESPEKSSMYLNLANELKDLAEKLRDAYDTTKDPNVIWDIYKQFGFDPTRV